MIRLIKIVYEFDSPLIYYRKIVVIPRSIQRRFILKENLFFFLYNSLYTFLNKSFIYLLISNFFKKTYLGIKYVVKLFYCFLIV